MFAKSFNDFGCKIWKFHTKKSGAQQHRVLLKGNGGLDALNVINFQDCENFQYSKEKHNQFLILFITNTDFLDT